MALTEDIAVRIGLDPRALSAGTRAVLRDLNSIKKSVRGVGDGFKAIGGAFSQFTKTASIAVGAATATGAALFGLAKAGSAAADAAGKTAQQLGLTVREFGRLEFAATQGGVSTEEFQSGLIRLNKTIADARQGVGLGANQFAALNIRLRDSKGRALGVSQIVNQLADRFAKLPDGVAKTAAAYNIFGRAGAKLIPLLNSGSRGIREVGDQAEALGIVFTDAQAKIGENFNDALARTTKGVTGLRNQIGLLIAPDLTRIFDDITNAIIRNRKEIITLAVNGYKFARQAVLDLFNAFAGNDAKVSQKWALEFRDTVLGVIETVRGLFNKIIIPLSNQLTELFKNIANGLNEAFGTKLTGAEVALGAFVFNVLGGFQAMGGALLIFNGILGITSGLFSTFATVIGGLVGGLAAIVGWPIALGAAFVVAGGLIFTFWDELKAAAFNAYEFITGIFGKLFSLFATAKDFVGGFTGSKESGSIDLQKRAGGGVVRGRGGSRSDSNLVAVSNGEYVVRAAAVQKFGTSFMDMINAGRMPAFADGGSVALQPINLTLPGVGQFEMAAKTDVSQNLIKAMRAAGRRTPGNSPSWKR